MSRRRLNAKYSVGIKIVLTIFLFIILGITGVWGFIYRFLPDWGPVWNWTMTALDAFVCYKLIDFILKDRRVLEFDDEWLYVINKKEDTEEQIPLRCIVALNRRPHSWEIGAYLFNRYSIHYVDDFYAKGKVAFMAGPGWRNLYEFEEKVSRQNPNFKAKRWTHSFDFWDKP